MVSIPRHSLSAFILQTYMSDMFMPDCNVLWLLGGYVAVFFPWDLPLNSTPYEDTCVSPRTLEKGEQ
jgi:hypothetical protein